MWCSRLESSVVTAAAWFAAVAQVKSLAWHVWPTSTCCRWDQKKFNLIYKKMEREVPIMAQWVTNPSSIHENMGLVPGLAQWVKYPMLL